MMTRRFAPVLVIVLAGLVTSAVCWWSARTFMEDVFGFSQFGAGVIGVWVGMVVGVEVARVYFSDDDEISPQS